MPWKDSEPFGLVLHRAKGIQIVTITNVEIARERLYGLTHYTVPQCPVDGTRLLQSYFNVQIALYGRYGR